MEKRKSLDSLKHYSILLIGAAILSFGLYNVHSQCEITEGGVLGLTLLLRYWFHITPGITGICIDLLCYIVAFKLLGKEFLRNAIFASIGFSLFYNFYERNGYLLPDYSNRPLLAALLGGVFVGVGVGLIVREGGASGGDDALALVISKLLKCRISKVYVLTDIIILVLSLSYIAPKRIVFSLITVFISSFMIERIHTFGRNTVGEDEIEGLIEI